MLPDPLKSDPIKPFVPDDPDLGFTNGYQSVNFYLRLENFLFYNFFRCYSPAS